MSDDDSADSTDPKVSSCRKLQGPTVRFQSTVKVHRHQLILGDHPDVSSGVPLMLDWDVSESETSLLNDQHSTPVKLSAYVRETIASAKHCKKELVNAREEVRSIKSSRQRNSLDKNYRWWWREIRIRKRYPSKKLSLPSESTPTRGILLGFRLWRR